MPTERERQDVVDKLARAMLTGRAAWRAGPTASLRERVVSRASGDVLEVAVGAGGNFEYYDRDRVSSLTICDVSYWMLEVASSRANEELGTIPLNAVRADCSNLSSLQDASFDTVVDTYGVCSFEDPIVALSELARVCRPDGRVLLLEHGISSFGPLAALMHFFAELWAWNHGCRCDFDILALVEASGRLDVLRAERRTLGMTYVLTCKPRDGPRSPGGHGGCGHGCSHG